MMYERLFPEPVPVVRTYGFCLAAILIACSDASEALIADLNHFGRFDTEYFCTVLVKDSFLAQFINGCARFK